MSGISKADSWGDRKQSSSHKMLREKFDDKRISSKSLERTREQVEVTDQKTLDMNIKGLKMKTIKMHKFGRVSINSKEEISDVDMVKKKGSIDEFDEFDEFQDPVDNLEVKKDQPLEIQPGFIGEKLDFPQIPQEFPF